MKQVEEEFSGFTKVLSFVPIKKERRAYDGERSKSKDRKKDYSKQRERKKNWE